MSRTLEIEVPQERGIRVLMRLEVSIDEVRAVGIHVACM
jgi:hypothetical protein